MEVRAARVYEADIVVYWSFCMDFLGVGSGTGEGWICGSVKGGKIC